MSEFVTVCKIADLSVGEARAFTVNRLVVGVFHVSEGVFRAINDFCPHAGASLSAGHFEDEKVICPLHAWCFSLKDGSWLDAKNSAVRVESYPVRVEGDEVKVAVP